MNNSVNAEPERESSKEMYRGEEGRDIYKRMVLTKRRETDASATARLSRFRVSLAICK